jgi:LacI family transcriptional regulator, fructose operon transcriptional repressor
MTNSKSTIYDIAELSGSSAGTVSAVLNGTWKKRRIKADTAEQIQKIADKLKYNVNRQASGLRKSRSGLIAMIIPIHDNRFFSSMSQTFERYARERNLHPIVASTLRDPALEVQTVKTLLSYQIEYLFVTGATKPDEVSKICKHHGVSHLNLDLPGTKAPSVVSDNFWGAQKLTEELLSKANIRKNKGRDALYFLGGVENEYATNGRIRGFKDTVVNAFGSIQSTQMDVCGYDSELAKAAIEKLYEKLGGLPKGLFINSTQPLEGVVRFLKTLPSKELTQCAFGCYDWDPFASFLSFPLLMVKQNTEALMQKAFELIDKGDMNGNKIFEIQPSLVSSEDQA